MKALLVSILVTAALSTTALAQAQDKTPYTGYAPVGGGQQVQITTVPGGVYVGNPVNANSAPLNLGGAGKPGAAPRAVQAAPARPMPPAANQPKR
jgi:hypothetical protein